VLIVDDHELAREALISIVRRQPDLEVVGEAIDGETAVMLAQQLRPALVLMDVLLPATSGLAATAAIKAALPATRVLMITSYDAQDGVLEGLRVGADGYLLKGVSRQALLDAIRACLHGQFTVQPSLAASVLGQIASPQMERPTIWTMLTSRQEEIMRLIVAGKSNADIARELSVSLNTVKSHVVHILGRLEVQDRTQAAVRAVHLGLLDETRRPDSTDPSRQ